MPPPAGETPALLIIDMVKDYFDETHPLPITPLARRIIAPINRLAEAFRRHGWPVVYSTDSFKPDDFIFTGRMAPHALTGTPGAENIDELNRQPQDIWLPKPRFSAFFATNLEEWLHKRGVTLCAVAGIATHFCVLTTALDAVCHDFKAVILEDATAAFSETVHRQTLDLYRKNPLYPLLRVVTTAELVAELGD
jgi:nicotinamidase-related amidase